MKERFNCSMKVIPEATVPKMATMCQMSHGNIKMDDLLVTARMRMMVVRMPMIDIMIVTTRIIKMISKLFSDSSEASSRRSSKLLTCKDNQI